MIWNKHLQSKRFHLTLRFFTILQQVKCPQARSLNPFQRTEKEFTQMCKERKFCISCWVDTMAAVQPLKIIAMLLVRCENHFDTLHKYISQHFLLRTRSQRCWWGPLLNGGPLLFLAFVSTNRDCSGERLDCGDRLRLGLESVDHGGPRGTGGARC